MPEASPPLALARMLNGHWLAQALYVAAKLRIADLLVDGSLSAQELAAATDTHAESLYRLLRTLASVGVFAEDSAGRFMLTPLAACLQKDVPNSQWAFAIMMGEESFMAWADLLYSVQTGECAFEKMFGKPLFQFLGEHPEKARVFDAAMTSVHGRESAAMLDSYDFAGIRTLVDVGGGNGSTLTAVLERHATIEGLLFDLPHVVAAAAEKLRLAGLAVRCRTAGGSFFEEVPSGADAYLLRHIIHDWYDEQATQILRTCRRAMGPQARLLVVENVILPGNEPAAGKILDLAMMVLPGGMERTADQYRALFAAADLKLVRIVPTAADVSVIEATAA